MITSMVCFGDYYGIDGEKPVVSIDDKFLSKMDESIRDYQKCNNCNPSIEEVVDALTTLKQEPIQELSPVHQIAEETNSKCEIRSEDSRLPKLFWDDPASQRAFIKYGTDKRNIIHSHFPFKAYTDFPLFVKQHLLTGKALVDDLRHAILYTLESKDGESFFRNKYLAYEDDHYSYAEDHLDKSLYYYLFFNSHVLYSQIGDCSLTEYCPQEKSPEQLEEFFDALKSNEKDKYAVPLDKDTLNSPFCKYSKQAILSGEIHRGRYPRKFFCNIDTEDSKMRSLGEMIEELGSGNGVPSEGDRWFFEKATGISMALGLYPFLFAESPHRMQRRQLCIEILNILGDCKPVLFRYRLSSVIADYLIIFQNELLAPAKNRKVGYDEEKKKMLLDWICWTVEEANSLYNSLLAFLYPAVKNNSVKVPKFEQGEVQKKASENTNRKGDWLLLQGCLLIFNKKDLLDILEKSDYSVDTRLSRPNDSRVPFITLQSHAIQNAFEQYQVENKNF